MKNLPIKISIVAIAIFVVLFSAILVVGSEKVIKNYNIHIGVKQLLTHTIDAKYIVTEIPDKSADEYEFAGTKYKMFCQYIGGYKGYNAYLKSHGCTVTTLTAVLRAYAPECKDWTPYETITIAEKETAGEAAFNKNYSKSLKSQMPFSFLGATQILDRYDINHEYVPFFDSDEELKEDITEHLKSGKPIMFVISQENRKTGEVTAKWTGSFHAMLMIGTDDKGNVLIGNPAGRQRFQLVSLDEMINYMFSCTKEPCRFYWHHKDYCGGYIKILE